jgi:hypothetical protein
MGIYIILYSSIFLIIWGAKELLRVYQPPDRYIEIMTKMMIKVMMCRLILTHDDFHLRLASLNAHASTWYFF